jgi:3'-phosphoadenosine 5'-phosphosulfate (PAPS) 3'-phosphatase
MAYVASGRLDGYWEYGLIPWDKAAGLLLIQEAGGIATDRQGNPADCESQSIVASDHGLHPSLLNALDAAHQFPINSRKGLDSFLPQEAIDALKQATDSTHSQ